MRWLVPVCLVACGSTAVATSKFDAGSRPRAAEVDAGACKAQLTYPALVESPHVAEGTVVQYSTNPPCVGPHYPTWAAFKEYDHPVDQRYLVHSLEHGAVILSYKCASPTECPDLVATLHAVRDAVPADSLCTDVRNRMIVVPDPGLKTRVAAAAWGAIRRHSTSLSATITRTALRISAPLVSIRSKANSPSRARPSSRTRKY
jgi:Protein of unknown function (DUF3105)